MMSSLDLNSCGTGIGYFYNGSTSFYYPSHDYNRPEQNAEASIDRTIQDHSADWHDASAQKLKNLSTDVLNWTQQHFYASLEGEITYGIQLAAGVKKGLDVNVNIVSQVLVEGIWSTHETYGRSYDLQSPYQAAKVKAFDFGASAAFGGNYNWNVKKGKWVSSQLSLGIYGFGGNLTWDKNGVSNLFIGFELGTKWAVGWGIEGSGKIGFNWDW